MVLDVVTYNPIRHTLLNGYCLYKDSDQEGKSFMSSQSNLETQSFETQDPSKFKTKRRPSLLILEGPREGCVFPLVHPEMLLGRHEECHIQLMHESVSRRHARVYLCEDSYHVRDLGSRNGVAVNGDVISQEKLREGDEIRIGQVVLKFSLTSQVEEKFWDRQQKSITLDPLTQIHNRRALETYFNAEWAFAKRHHRPLSLLMLDIDHFKSINDRFGHSVGDDVICSVAKALVESFRHEDFVARYGGEEFVVVLRETKSQDAMELAERARKTIEALTLPTNENVTISVGGASISEELKSVEWLIKRADAALYEAKEKGRNQCAYFRPPPATTGVKI